MFYCIVVRMYIKKHIFDNPTNFIFLFRFLLEEIIYSFKFCVNYKFQKISAFSLNFVFLLDKFASRRRNNDRPPAEQKAHNHII